MKGGDLRTQRMFRAAPVASAPAPKASPYADEDHRCAQPGCARWGAFSFGPPGYGSPARWACAEHRAAVEGMGMTTRVFVWGAWDDLSDLLRLGWLPCERGDLCHHNHYSTLCEWRCACGRAAKMPGGAA